MKEWNLEESKKKRQLLDEDAMKQCQYRLDHIAKPLNSLGKLEQLVVKLAGIYGTDHVSVDKKALAIMCADNGIVKEGVTQTGQEVTKIVSENFLYGKTTVTIMAQEAKVDLYPIDIGIATDSKIPSKKIAYGTKNFAIEPAMTESEVRQAIQVGIDLVKQLQEAGYQVIGTGEMGIGNTTTSSAIAAVLLEQPVELVTGKGAGLSNQGLQRKIEVIEQAIKRYDLSKEKPMEVLQTVGGFDIAGLVGVYLGGMLYRIPIVLDGFISSVAALVAANLVPEAKQFMIASHISKEPAGHLILEALELDPMLDCQMCLGEGTGAIAFMPLLSMACKIYMEMSTFSDIHIEDYKPL